MINKQIIEMTADEILGDDTFSVLFELSDIDREQVRTKLLLRAKDLHIKGIFDSAYKAHERKYKEKCRDEKQKIKQLTLSSQMSNISLFTTDRYDVYSTGAWHADDGGVWLESPILGQIVACPHPILIVKRLINLETKDEKVVIAFKRDNAWRERIFDKATIFQASKLVPSMANCGVLVTSESAKYLVKYFCELENLNSDIIPIQYSTSKMGWDSDYNEFMPFTQSDVVFDSEANFTHVYNSIKSKGSRDACFELLKQIRKIKRKEPIMCLSASLASVLVQPCGVLPFIFHLFGEAGKGKSIATMLAASIWGDPNEDGYMADPNSTATAFEAYLDFLNNLPFICDDMSRLRRVMSSNQKGDFGEFIYFLCGMAGKKRSNVNLGVNRPRTWHNCSITNAERPLTKETSNGGELLRVIELKTDAGAIFPDELGGKLTADIIRANYGYLGREFIEVIKTLGIDTVKSIHDGYASILFAMDTEGKKEGKQIQPMALLLTADFIFTEYIMKDNEFLDIDFCFNMIINKEQMNDLERAYEFVINELNLNERCFFTNVGYEPPQRWGYIKDGYWLINPNIFSQIAEKGNFNKKMFVEWAMDCDKAIADKGRIDKYCRINGVTKRFIYVKNDQNITENYNNDYVQYDGKVPF